MRVQFVSVSYVLICLLLVSLLGCIEKLSSRSARDLILKYKTYIYIHIYVYLTTKAFLISGILAVEKYCNILYVYDKKECQQFHIVSRLSTNAVLQSLTRFSHNRYNRFRINHSMPRMNTPDSLYLMASIIVHHSLPNVYFEVHFFSLTVDFNLENMFGVRYA